MLRVEPQESELGYHPLEHSTVKVDLHTFVGIGVAKNGVQLMKRGRQSIEVRSLETRHNVEINRHEGSTVDSACHSSDDDEIDLVFSKDLKDLLGTKCFLCRAQG